MGACNSRDEQYKAGDSHPPRKTLTPEEIRQTNARDSLRFNNRRKNESAEDAADVDDDLASQRLVHHQRDSMVFNNRTHASRALELSLVTTEDFVCGCRDVLRSPTLLEKLRDTVTDGSAPYERVDMVCVSMIPRDEMFKFYSQECLRHAMFVSCHGPADVTSEEPYETLKVPADKLLVLLRNMFFLKRMQLCFTDEDCSAEGVSKTSFRVACSQPESVFSDHDDGALFDRVASDVNAEGNVDWRHLVSAIADQLINPVALPSLE